MTTPTKEKFGTETVNVGERWRHAVTDKPYTASVARIENDGHVLLVPETTDVVDCNVIVSVGELLARWVRVP